MEAARRNHAITLVGARQRRHEARPATPLVLTLLLSSGCPAGQLRRHSVQIAIGFHRTAITDWDELSTYTIEAERMGVAIAWSAEAWDYDAATPLAYLAAKTARIRLGSGIFQIGARTPALVAMTAMALDSMSGGRFILGLGTSGPQVIEAGTGSPSRARSSARAS